jgi:hypothetical protein
VLGPLLRRALRRADRSLRILGGCRAEVDVVLLCRERGADQIGLAVRGALAVGVIDSRAVSVLARRAHNAAPPAPLTGLGGHVPWFGVGTGSDGTALKVFRPPRRP